MFTKNEKNLWIASHSAFALIIYKNNLLLFLRENKKTIPYPNYWHLPGGRMDESESPSQAIKRELQEEITYIPRNIQYIGRFKKEDGKYTHTFLCTVDEDETKLFKLGPGEGQAIKFFDIKELSNLKLTDTVKFRLVKYKNLISA